MADSKISDLTVVSVLNLTDQFPVVQSATTKSATITDVLRQVQDRFIITIGDETTPFTAATGVYTFRMPYGFIFEDLRASLTTAGSTSGLTTIDINEGGVSILSTKLTIDVGETTSTTATTSHVFSDGTLADDAEITIDIDTITAGGTEAGLKIYFIGKQSI